MTDDAELLRTYVDKRSEAAFAELVQRHVDLVYSSCLRQMYGDHHRAKEVTQMVFIDLARKAASLVRHPVLPAWLHRSSHLSCLALRRAEARRHGYEKASAVGLEVAPVPDANIDWASVAPVLDSAINELNEQDRQAVLLRFFSGCRFGEIGDRLKLTENAARMKVERAVAKLRDSLERRGITSSSAALAAVLGTQTAIAAPAGVASASTAAALAVGAGAGGACLTFMASSKLPLALTAAALLSGTAVIAIQEKEATQSEQRTGALEAQNLAIPTLVRQNGRLAASALQDRSLLDDASRVSILEAQVRDHESSLISKASGQGSAIQTENLHGKIDPGAAVYDYAKLDQRPKPLKLIQPTPVAEMPSGGASGRVLVDFLVGTDGFVYNASAVESSSKAFAFAAVAAVSQWVFTPGQVGGQSVNVHMQVPIEFDLHPDSGAPAAVSWF